jgi:hypothetical protein
MLTVFYRYCGSDDDFSLRDVFFKMKLVATRGICGLVKA